MDRTAKVINVLEMSLGFGVQGGSETSLLLLSIRLTHRQGKTSSLSSILAKCLSENHAAFQPNCPEEGPVLVTNAGPLMLLVTNSSVIMDSGDVVFAGYTCD